MTRRSPAALIAAALALILLAASCAPPPPRERAADHPLIDRIWSSAEGRFVTSAELLDRMAAARFVLLGEVHDNPRHHQLQAWAVKALAERNRKLSLVAEMIAADQAPGLALFEAEPRTRAASLATFLNWAQSGWPDFVLYEPIFDAAVRAGFPLVPGNLDRSMVPAMHRAGLAALPEADRQRLGLEKGVPDEAARILGRSIAEAHCGVFGADSEDKLARFVAIQYARDAVMARAMADAAGGDGAILIAGAGHVRRDAGVPHHLARMGIPGKVVAIAFVEAAADRAAPQDYDEDADYLWFTGGPERADPCAAVSP